MLYDFSDKNSVNKFNNIKSLFLKKVLSVFITNINHRNTLTEINDIPTLNILYKSGFRPDFMKEENMNGQIFNNNAVIESISSIDQLKWLEDRGFDFNYIVKLNSKRFKSTELREYYINNVFSIEKDSNKALVGIVEACILKDDIESFLLYSKKYDINLKELDFKDSFICTGSLLARVMERNSYHFCVHMLENGFDFEEGAYSQLIWEYNFNKDNLHYPDDDEKQIQIQKMLTIKNKYIEIQQKQLNKTFESHYVIPGSKRRI